MIKYFLEGDYELARASHGASGHDLRAALSVSRDIAPGQRWLVPTGLYLEMPVGVEAQVRSRSGLAINHGVVVLNAPGTIDSDYRGEVKVSLINLGDQHYTIVPGERIAQLVFSPVFINGRLLTSAAHTFVRVPSPADLEQTDRGAGGHGSTGR